MQTWEWSLSFPREISFLAQLHLGRLVPWPWVNFLTPVSLTLNKGTVICPGASVYLPRDC